MGFNQPPHMAPPSKEVQTENALVSKLVHLLDHEDTEIVYEMLVVARQHINAGGKNRVGQTLVAVVFAAFRLTQRVFDAEHGINDDEKKTDDADKESEALNGDPTGEKTEEGESKEGEEKGPEEDGEPKEGSEKDAEGEQKADEGKEGEEIAKDADASKEEPESTSPKADLKDDINGREVGEASAAKTVT
jgi:vacuolar protein sorting-associated protein 35